MANKNYIKVEYRDIAKMLCRARSVAAEFVSKAEHHTFCPMCHSQS